MILVWPAEEKVLKETHVVNLPFFRFLLLHLLCLLDLPEVVEMIPLGV